MRYFWNDHKFGSGKPHRRELGGHGVCVAQESEAVDRLTGEASSPLRQGQFKA
jgi:hypothetical protein